MVPPLTGRSGSGGQGHSVSKEEKEMSFAFAFLGLKRRAWFVHPELILKMSPVSV